MNELNHAHTILFGAQQRSIDTGTSFSPIRKVNFNVHHANDRGFYHSALLARSNLSSPTYSPDASIAHRKIMSGVALI
jgi:hypothetical protein